MRTVNLNIFYDVKLYIFLFCMFILMLTACGKSTEKIYKPEFTELIPLTDTEYVFGVHPLHNPQRLFELFNPLTEYLSKNIQGAVFKLEASRNYASYDKKLYSKQFHFSLPNPFQTINAIDIGYEVFGKMADDQSFRGIILVRKDSGIKKVSDLKGKAVSYPAPTALAATMMPQYYLQTHGVDVMTELDNKYVGSQESSIMNVFLGQTVAGSTWPPPWRAFKVERPEIAEQLVVIWETEPLIDLGLVVLPTVPKVITDQVIRLLIDLNSHKEGQNILMRMNLSAFEKANNESYLPIREFIKNFSLKVRPLAP